MIKKILIKNYRSINKIQINNVCNSMGLIGENSSGKSTILSAILAFLGEYNVKDSDFRFDKDGNREEEIVIGIGLDFDKTETKRILDDVELNESKPSWYANAIEKCKGQRTRKKNSDLYLDDLRKNIKTELGICKQRSPIYLKVVYKMANDVEEEIFLTKSDFDEAYETNVKQEEIKQFKNIIQPRYAYLHDERNFNEEGLGKIDSTTNKLFNLLLPSMNVKSKLENKTIEETPISELSIPQINQYLLKKIKSEAQKVTAELNKNFKEAYNDNVEIEWQFSNRLFENINIKTNFKFTNIKSVGSGTRSLYKIVLLQTLSEMQKKEAEPVLFLLEEPELYLYPKLEKQMSKFICDIARDNQVILTTHSHISIVSFKRESLLKVYRKKERKDSLPVTKIEKIDSSLEAMNLLGYDITYLLGKEYLIFVEGKEDQKAYEYIVKEIFGDNLSSKFVIMTGVSKLEMAVNCSVLKYINTNSKSVYIIDSDGGESKNIKDKAISEIIEHDTELNADDLNDKIILTKYCMLECYTFEKALLINNLTDEEFAKIKIQFIDDNEEDINKCLNRRKKKNLDKSEISSLSDDDKFEYVRKYGFDKDLVKKFRGIIGGSGFRKIEQLNKKELEMYCSSLIQDLEKHFV